MSKQQLQSKLNELLSRGYSLNDVVVEILFERLKNFK